jgi:hypothetical protein
VPFPAHIRPDHDETLVVRLAADDLAPRELDAVRAQVVECPACAQLLIDLRSIASATAELPTPRRVRDFRLTEADAVRLRPAGWRGLLARFGSPGFAFVKPLAGGLAALGIAGLILASFPLGFGASSSGVATRDLTAAGGSASAAPAAAPGGSGDGRSFGGPVAAPGGSGGVGTSSDNGDGVTGPASGPEVAGAPGATDKGAPTDASAGRDQATNGGRPSTLVVLSIVLLAAAIVLAGLRLIGRRLA